MVSVIIPTYNCARYINESIKSVLDQTYKDFEIIVIDDGSADNTKSVLQTYVESGKIKYIYQGNMGPGAARNRGIQMSGGDYIAFLDADDILLPDSLQKRVRLFEKYPFLDMVFSDVFIESIEGQGLEQGFLQKKEFLKKFGKMIEIQDNDDIVFKKDLYIHMFKPPFMSLTITIMTKRSAFDRVGMFRTDITSHEDKDMWLRLAENGRVGFVAEPLVIYKNYRSSLTVKDAVRRANNRIKFYNTVLDRFANDREMCSSVKKRFAWINFDLCKHYRNEKKYGKFFLHYAKSLYYNPRNRDVLRYGFASLIPKKIKKLGKSCLR
jgi:glycosyltransferase involved in cell wall biosynthesis